MVTNAVAGSKHGGVFAASDIVFELLVQDVHGAGVDIFRVFDALNDVDQMRPAIRAAIEVGAVAEGRLCCSGGQLATYLAAILAGVDAIDGASPPLSGMTSQPSLAAIIAATDHSPRARGLALEEVSDLELYWEAVRRMYRSFEAGLNAPTGRVYKHEIPGGLLANFRQHAVALGLGDRFENIDEIYAARNKILGRSIKVKPSSKVVGDMALRLVAYGVTPAELEGDPASVDLPGSVVAFLRGSFGTPEADPALELGDDDLKALHGPSARTMLSRLLFPAPAPAASQEGMTAKYSDLAALPSRLFRYGMQEGDEEVQVVLDRGVRMLVGLEAIGEPNEAGMRSVVFQLNGLLRPIDVVDRSVTTGIIASEKADGNRSGHVATPFRGNEDGVTHFSIDCWHG